MKRGKKDDDLNTSGDIKKSEQLQKKMSASHKDIDLNMFQSTYSKLVL